MYPSNSNSKIIELSHIPPKPEDIPLLEPNVTEPIILSHGSEVSIAYYINHYIPGTPSEDIALITFSFCADYRWGWPNDEASNGHPLYTNGLRPLMIAEVQNSPWIEQLYKLNSIHPNNNPQMFKNLRHFIFAFHDSMFECIAKEYSVEKYNGELKDMISLMESKIKL